jgi:hypothetical protein
MLLQVDGSKHDWLEGRGAELCLIAAIDDATGEVPWALFRPEEDSAGYFLLLQHVFRGHGLPFTIYADRHSIFQSPKKASIAEQLSGKPPRSQLSRLLDELDIQLIPAYAPQAKGRIERLFGTFQDRLVKALRQAKASSLEDANQVLPHFIPAKIPASLSLRPGHPPRTAPGRLAFAQTMSSASSTSASWPKTTPFPSAAIASRSSRPPTAAPTQAAASRYASSSTVNSQRATTENPWFASSHLPPVPPPWASSQRRSTNPRLLPRSPSQQCVPPPSSSPTAGQRYP